MRKSFPAKLGKINDDLVKMCRGIEGIVGKSLTAIAERDTELAKQVRHEEKQIDKLERKIEKACINLLLMEHPVAGDFRDVYSALKMAVDLERVADQARDIAKFTKKFAASTNVLPIPEAITRMTGVVQQMLSDGVHAYINRDLDLARSIEAADDAADALFKTAKKEIVKLIQARPPAAEQGLMLLMIAKYLERIGDHAVNISEWAEYRITGRQPE